ncbi:MAG: phosphatidylglycerol lysyltransferase domain-containing protein [Candidatus Brocadiaceae bacterium]
MHRLKIEDKKLFDGYLKEENVSLCDYSFANNFIWKGSMELLWKIINSNFCLFGVTSKGMCMMLPPLGKNNIQSTLNECFSIMSEMNHSNGSESYVNYVYEGFLKYFDNSSYRIIEGYPDYIYKTSDLIKLAGRKYEKKRNEINFFKKHYPASYERFYSKHIADALLMVDQWKKEKIQESNLSNHHESHYQYGLIHEAEAAKCAIIFSEELGLFGANVMIHGKIEGITLGERVTPNTGSVLIEKTNNNFHGMPQVIYQQFCASDFHDVEYINAGEDWGIEGLRRAKMSYHPCMMARKFLIYERS